ncbi:hypothetical protein [Aromatoleum buckelii]|uniref:Uncharacterized protein n=1 Tax=Aromatoleum buckelii TaxID=200254 RepID=A0ABX1N7L1_9RHOO|nr:hypothetical protein [Aromatoleum buckelii]MCK0513239.1 hypothetical protein [Aromatoleum buckelii]
MSQRSIRAHRLAIALALAYSGASPATDPSHGELGPLAAALFATVPPAALSQADRREIAALTPLALRDGIVVSSLLGCETAMHPEVTVEDLNGDGVSEVFVVAGNSCTSGMTGSSIWLFAKRLDGRWSQRLDVTGVAYRVLPTTTQGWRDLAIGGRGSCHGVWRFAADNKYRYVRSVKPDGTACPGQ